MKTKRTISMTLIIIMLLALLPGSMPVLAARPPNPWAVPEMNDANTSGLLTPSAARDFQNPLTRDEFCELVVEMVERTLGYALPVPAYNPFVDDKDPISIHALKAYGYGIIDGMTPTTFLPASYVERQQLCVMMIRAVRGLERNLNRTFLSPAIQTLPYKDAAKIKPYAVDAVKLAYSFGIMLGDDQNNFLPSNNISSQECVAVIIRSFNRIETAREPNMTTAQLLDAAENRIHVGYAFGDTEFGVTQNVLLPTSSTGGATVTWTSSDSNIIRISGENGIVNVGNSARSVTLTATIRIGNSTRAKVFVLTTSTQAGDRLLLDNALKELDILYINEGDNENCVTGRIGLPSGVLSLPVTWHSSNPGVVSTAGVVNVPSGNEPRYATLTATITLNSQVRTKTFTLTVVNPSFSGDVTLHGIQLGMSQTQVNQILGTVRRTITASNSETWQLYHNSSYSNFIAVAFIGNRAVAVYSMASGAANQLKNRTGAVITVAQANSAVNVSAVSYTDPGNSSQQYAIMIYESASVIGTSRTLNAEGQEQLLFELINAFRVRHSRSVLVWAERLGTPARAHSSNRGSGNLQQRVRDGGFDNARYAGGDYVAGDNDSFDALNQIISYSSGSSSMRTAILQNNATLLGTGFAGGQSGTYRTYFTYALGAVTAITGVTARQNNANVSTINVGTSATADVVLSITPTGYNETFEVASSNTSRFRVTNVTVSGASATVTLTGVSAGSANIVVTGNCSSKSFTIPVSVGTVYANNLQLVYTDFVTNANTTLTNNNNVSANTNASASFNRTLIIGTGDTMTIAASTTNGAAVEWSRTSGSAANVAKSASNNNGVVTATSSTGDVTIRARVLTGSNTYITHTFTVRVVSVSAITGVPQTMNVGGPAATASVTVGNVPSGTGVTQAVYAWTSSGNQLTKTSTGTETNSATFVGANQGNTTITLNITWSGTSANTFLGRIRRTFNTTVQGYLYANGIDVPDKVEMIPGQELIITAKTLPQGVTQNHVFAWSSFAGTGDATVTGSGASGSVGTIKAIKPGNVQITVRLTHPGTDRPTIEKNITVTVKEFPTIIIDGPEEITAESIVQYTYVPVGLPTGLTALPDSYSVKWSYEDNPDPGPRAFIQQNGLLSAHAAGSGTVIAELLYTDSSGTSVIHIAMLPIRITEAP